MAHTMKGFCILILVSIAPTALAHTIERISLVWLCPATGFVHSTCNNSISKNSPANHQLKEGCKLTREGSQNPAGVILKNETDLLINLNGDTDHDINFNVVGLNSQYY
jgi:hypothetical protein